MSEDIREKVIDIVVERFDSDKATLSDATSYIEDLNADSLDIAEMVLEFEDTFEITIPDDEKGIQTIGDTVEYIKNTKS